ncbi:MAG: amidohydrolase, partial [Alphaproteobacteria bacterium]|nr:amidohydrolase [Alphaproteobacteria bacterium]
MTESTIFTARRIATLEGARPTATAVAIRDGQILAVGDESELRAHGPARLDARFADRFILPGFVEAHAHVTAGANWKHCHVGYYDRVAPDGKIRPGARSLDEVIDRLARAERVLPDPDQPLLGWAFDPIFFGGRRMTAAQLDRISTTRP